ncbi:DNA-binding protein [Riemerella anatipestifer Yb2]|uniref:KilA-N domain-containing protein n=1 Tax=Riemerella anatipestifer TaxID=34085 RepID=UPI00066EE8CF|nr:KilA-N domain-containing protein [Riemerella anatipestifer]AKQ39420.1 DNA-binding protein [Riemerella anatipestifer Yb2]
MLHTNNKAHNAVQMVVLNDHRFAVEERNGNISFNLTQMAKPYRKRPADWLKYEESKTYIDALAVALKVVTADLVEVRQGGKPENQGTWTTDYRIAVRFAQWLDVKFAIAVDELIWKLITKQAMVVEPKNGVFPVLIEGQWLYPYTEVLRSLDASTRSSASRRKAKFPKHFKKAFGRNFITGHLFDVLKSFYDYKNAQLTLNFDA